MLSARSSQLANRVGINTCGHQHKTDIQGDFIRFSKQENIQMKLPYQFGTNPGPSLHHPKEPWLDQNNVVHKTILAPWCNHLKKTIGRPSGDQPNQPPRPVRLVPLENYNHDRTMVKPSENHDITEQRRF